MIYLTSDLHWFHNQKFIYEPRGFKSCEEMMDYTIDNWMKTATNKDEVYVDGDFCLGTNFDAIEKLIKSLPGRIHLLIGNHDTNKKVEFYKNLGIDVKYEDTIEYNGQLFKISHYPPELDKLEDGVIYLHGHLHTKEKFHDGTSALYNVSVDCNDNKLITLEDVLFAINERKNLNT